ncbi:UDP-N-acetylglucosamine 2-epimerase (non-hydrolyzing) [Roseovarius sp. TE539]|uniref:non-hydrolyzing UDP-N-acetylglucosamine 2-epimerase n=1 Tax=Roseovarius sp. TE539 TaxID=2249812 RepID=UPI000DE0DEE4|nr:UDP-N-acetylglucosamine 2-epimerase (non-hydrolyzing) [Roseovarius sp. TE539]RBI69009.1 UDP-N-acetylglucosamine 2-epimerase (non-hydrolyzing) [Roseovarius sp. TE539]
MTNKTPVRVTCIVGARPNFMKMAPILAAFEVHGDFDARLIHTGQHYDVEMNAVFFQQLGLPEPDLNLGVGSGTQTTQTAQVMIGLENEFLANSPDLVLVVGDVNSTVAAALVAAKMRIPVAHVEAGLRSFDRDMPEEINRLVTDRISDLLLTTERAAGEQLEREGISSEAIHFVGNVMIDSLLSNLKQAVPIAETLSKRGFDQDIVHSISTEYALVTLHRPTNVDNSSQLSGLLDVLSDFAKRMPIVFTLHPRTRARIDAASLNDKINGPGFHVVPPLDYFAMLGATKGASLVVTDSGGLQEETTALGIPCLTVRENTERPITIKDGTNTLVGASPDLLAQALGSVSKDKTKHSRTPELWDGHAAQRIATVIYSYIKSLS